MVENDEAGKTKQNIYMKYSYIFNIAINKNVKSRWSTVVWRYCLLKIRSIPEGTMWCLMLLPEQSAGHFRVVAQMLPGARWMPWWFKKELSFTKQPPLSDAFGHSQVFKSLILSAYRKKKRRGFFFFLSEMTAFWKSLACPQATAIWGCLLCKAHKLKQAPSLQPELWQHPARVTAEQGAGSTGWWEEGSVLRDMLAHSCQTSNKDG